MPYNPYAQDESPPPGSFNMVTVPPPEVIAQELLKAFPEWSPEVTAEFAATEAGDEAARAVMNGDPEEAQGMYEKFYSDAGLDEGEAMAYPTKLEESKLTAGASVASGLATPNRAMKTDTLSSQAKAIPQVPSYMDEASQSSSHPKDDPEAYRSDWNYEDNYPGPSFPPNAEADLKQIIGELSDSTVSGDDLHNLMSRRSAIDPQEFYKFLSSGAMPRALVDLYGNGALKNSDLQDAYQRYINEQEINPLNDPEGY